MTLSAFVFVTLLIFAAWFCHFSARTQDAGDTDSIAECVVYAGLLGGAQIVFSEIVLGALMLLHRPLLVVLNVGLSLAVLGRVLARRRAAPAPLAAVPAWRELVTWENLALLALLAFLSAWMFISTWLLPPRGIDDVYHLPPLYQYVRQGGISLLPLELRDQFAAPFNGEFLYLWPLIFFRADTWIDGVQYVVGLYGAVVLYALGRCFGLPRGESGFVALLFPFVPVVLGQAGSNYVDLSVAVCQLVLLYAVVRFWQTGLLAHLLIAGCATGFGLGMKYIMLITVAAVQPMIWLRLWSHRDPRLFLRRYTAYFAAALPLGVFWMGRNLATTGHLLYPFRLGVDGLRKVAESHLALRFGPRPPGNALLDFLRDPASLVTYVFSDPGLGSFHGGFGVVFWGLGLPALLYCGWGALQSLRRRDYLPALFWAYVPLAFLTLFLQLRTPRLQYDQRYIIVVVPLGLLALGLALQALREHQPGAVAAIRALGVLASAAAVVQLAAYQWPSFRILPAAMDRVAGRWTSEYKYLREAPFGLPALSTAWEPLDFLSRGGPGWDVYIAVDWPFFWTSATFGSRIQNRVWNFEPAPTSQPDAFIYYRRAGRELFYLGARITPEEVARAGAYELVTVAGGAEFWVRRPLLEASPVKARLAEFYRRNFEIEIQALGAVVAALPADTLLLTSHPLGHALRYLALTGPVPLSVRLVPSGGEWEEARRAGLNRFVSVGTPVPGFRARPVAAFAHPSADIPFFVNEREP